MATRRYPHQLGLFTSPSTGDGAEAAHQSGTAAEAPQLALFESAEIRQTSSAREERRVGAAPVAESVHALARSLPTGIRMGTSSWSFPGWAGMVYAAGRYSPTVLSNSGLAAYGRHPLLRAVGVDRTFYGSVETDVFRAYAAQVPSDFRFLVKAQDVCTTPFDRGRGTANAHFLDPVWAGEVVVRPYVDGLLELAGPLLFQFPPLPVARLGGVREVHARLRTFLDGLPKGPWYAVEFRNPELFSAEWYADMAARDVSACVNVHPAALGVGAQRQHLEQASSSRLVVRWMLRPDRHYAEAKEEFAPFDRRLEPDEESVNELSRTLLWWAERGEGVVIVNNKAEGSSPLSIEALSRRWSALRSSALP